jgi:hypothetical protein
MPPVPPACEAPLDGPAVAPAESVEASQPHAVASKNPVIKRDCRMVSFHPSLELDFSWAGAVAQPMLACMLTDSMRFASDALAAHGASANDGFFRVCGHVPRAMGARRFCG